MRESDSVLLLQAEFWRHVWSELGSVTKLSRQGVHSLYSAQGGRVYIVLRSLLSLEEESGGAGTCGGEFWSTCSGASGEIVKSKT